MTFPVSIKFISLKSSEIWRFRYSICLKIADKIADVALTGISTCLSGTKSAAQVALEAGNSPEMLFEHYRELVTEAEANEWFSFDPKKVQRPAA